MDIQVKKIILLGDKKLISKSHKINTFGDGLKRLVQDMIATLDAYNGVGLAAVQIGELRRVAIIRISDTLLVEADDPDVLINLCKDDMLILVNPEILEQSGTRTIQEGCLSIPGKWGNVKRPENITIQAQDIHGKKFKIRNAIGLLAQCISHELDHLNGVMFFNKLASEDKNVSKMD